MTRSDDQFVSLPERVRMARSQQAALFISIHADALTKATARPAERPSIRCLRPRPTAKPLGSPKQKIAPT
jgi:N-acetylmuramoyl-L-alanine amidase